MANLSKWTALSSGVSLADNTCLASRADGYLGVCQVSATDVVIDNATDKNLFLAIELELGAAAWPVGGWFDFYLIPAFDGTNYDLSGTLPAADKRIARIGTHGATSAMSSTAIQVSAWGVQIPPGKFKLAFVNESGVTTAASSNAATIYTYNVDLNG